MLASSFLLPPPPSPPNSLTRTEFRPHSAPPLSRGMWAQTLTRRTKPAASGTGPSAFQTGCGHPRRRSTGGMREGNTQGGTQEVGGPASASPNVSHDVCHGSFSPSPRSFYPTAHLRFQHRQGVRIGKFRHTGWGGGGVSQGLIQIKISLY